MPRGFNELAAMLSCLAAQTVRLVQHRRAGAHRERPGPQGGVLFGEYRAKRMAPGERIARSLGAPLVPALRLWRLLRSAGRLLQGGSPWQAYSLLPLLLVGHAAGEVAGYWRLVRGIEARYEHFELHRIACLRAGEEALLLNPRG
jgi:hypothetical protein